MIHAGLVALATQGGAVDGPLGTPGGVVAAVLAAIAGVAAAVVPIVKVLAAHREHVSGDERQARTDAREDRKDAVSEWQAIAATYKAERDAAIIDAQTFQRENVRLRDQHMADRMAGLVHAGWDYNTREAVSRANAALTSQGLEPIVIVDPPPLYAPPVHPPHDS